MKIVCYAEPTENGLLLHYPSSSVKAELLHLWEGAIEKKIAELEKEDRVEK